MGYTRTGKFVVMIKTQSTMIPAYLYNIENQVSNPGWFWASFFYCYANAHIDISVCW